MRYQIKLLTAATLMAGLILTTGCDRRTPEERLATAVQFYQQGDAASAEMEALQVLEKSPDDPAAVEASIMLAQIYASQNRFNEVEMQLESALGKVSQLDPMGKQILNFYLMTLKSQEKYDDALETVDKYQQEYAEDPGTSLSLRVARTEIQTLAGDTEIARAALDDIIDETTHPEILSLYRDRYVQTYLAEDATTDAINYLKGELEQAESTQDRQPIISILVGLYVLAEDYESSRAYLSEYTDNIMEGIDEQSDPRNKAALALQLANTYTLAGNLPGSQRVLETVYDSAVTSDPQVTMAIVQELTETLLRSGETSAVEELMVDAARKHPDGPFVQGATQFQQLIASGQLEHAAPVDTSTLVLKYRDDENVLWPPRLPEIFGVESRFPVETTATVQAETPAPAPAQPESRDQATTGAVETVEPVAAPAEASPAESAPVAPAPEAAAPPVTESTPSPTPEPDAAQTTATE